MLTLITGLPGAGKTLNLIKMIDTDPAYQNRPIYYFNIKELKLDWEEIDEAQARKWYELPDNSVIIMDECQRLFRPQKYADAVPRAIEEFETHRHRGFDIFLITQNPKLIDTKVRYLCGQHINFERQYGFRRVRKLVWQKCVSDTEDYHARLEAEISRITLDKKYFGVYKSTEVDTHKSKVPKKLIYVIAFASIPFGVLGYLYSKYSNAGDSAEIQQVASIDSLSFGRPIDGYDMPHNYLDRFIPRIAGLPHTAPFYDEITVPVTFPKPNCVLQLKAKKCKCYSQQATHMDVHYQMCVNIVENGWFDYTKEEKRQKKDKRKERPRVSSNDLKPQYALDTVVYDINGKLTTNL